MRIVYVSPVGELGGAEQCLLNVMASVRDAAPATDIHLIVATDGPLVGRAREMGVHTRLLPMPDALAALGNSILHRRKRLAAAAQLVGQAVTILPQARRYLSDLRRAIQSLSPTVIHSNGLKTHLLTSLAGVTGPALIWHIHDFLGARPAMGRALRLAARRAAGAIAISDAVARDTRAVLPHTRIETVYNAIDLGHFTPSTDGEARAERLDELAGLRAAPPHTVRVGLVATFAKWKGQDLLLEAARRFYAGNGSHPVRFYVVGGPIYKTGGSQFSEQDLRNRAAALGIADRVGFIGFQRDTRSIYRALDVVVHASTQPEPFGLTIVEAMACARPVIVSQAGGAAELFTANEDAIGVPPGNAEALAAAVRQLVEDPAARTRLGQEAYRTAVRRFGRGRLGGEILAAYSRLRDGQ